DLLPEPPASLTAASTLNWLRRFEMIAREAASRLPDKTGRPSLAAFDSFIRLLADAFGRAAGRPASLTWSEARGGYKGSFWDLVGYVLPRTQTICRRKICARRR